MTLRTVYGQTQLVASGPSLLNVTPTIMAGRGTAAATHGYTLTFTARTARGLHLAPTPNCSYVVNLLNRSYGTTLSSDDECCSAIPPFEVLSTSGVWSPASATLLQGQVKVTAGTSMPIGIRYAWADYPICMLYNAQGGVASPFIRASCDFDGRTKYTSWPMLDNTQGNAKPGANAGSIYFIGRFDSASACAEKVAAVASINDDGESYKSYAWFASDYTNTSGNFANACYARSDEFWHPTNGCPNGDPGCGKHNVTSGQICPVKTKSPKATESTAGTCPSEPTFMEGYIRPDALTGLTCELMLPHYGVGVCPGSACQSYQDFWSIEAVMKAHYPNCTREKWPHAWQPQTSIKFGGGCTLSKWQLTINGKYCPDPNKRPLPCPDLNISTTGGGKTIVMETCQQSSTTSAAGGWEGFDAVADYLMSSAVVDPWVCGRMPSVTSAIQKLVCPNFTLQMAAQAAAYPANLPVLAAINRTCDWLSLRAYNSNNTAPNNAL